MSEHTPGPWTAIQVEGGEWTIWREGTNHFVTETTGTMATEANARLIAAAPDLLEALEALVDPCDCYGRERGDHSVLCNRARDAIAKARGQA